ncbi:hypothetical protein GCM10022198_21310 [Klugiella xanthotipulae]|uniref:Uncharacterized protein n=1 Tax=Klugiella xanthotipulae TaxID=244735 RepID=A0A543HXZ3_9MICO|nr:hypothetical protein [Klugiella xanthotipulae]TQM63218.1 hypothetical protein FB466_1474 [Klugiella xanthotipulae]
MSISKYILNGGIIGSAVSLVSTIKKTENSPRDWRTILTWVIWGCTLAIAIGSVALRDSDKAYEELHK